MKHCLIISRTCPDRPPSKVFRQKIKKESIVATAVSNFASLLAFMKVGAYYYEDTCKTLCLHMSDDGVNAAIPLAAIQMPLNQQILSDTPILNP